jgi:hypothetical protein
MSVKSGYIQVFLITGFLFLSVSSPAQRIMEKLTRGTVAVVSGTDGVFISWRLLATEHFV